MKINLFFRIQLIMLFATFSSYGAAMTCENLFATAQISEVLIENQTDRHSQLKITDKPFHADPKRAALEIIKAALRTSDFKLTEKNFLDKNTLTLGFPLPQGYNMEVSYVSNSAERPEYVIEKIKITSPYKEKKYTYSDLLKITDNRLTIDPIELSEKLPFLADIQIELPLTLEAETLNELTRYSRYFEFFSSKEELRTVFKSEHIQRIKSQLFLRKAVDIFKKVLIKEPFKLLVGGVMMFSVLTLNNNFQFIELQPSAQINTPAQNIPQVQFKHEIRDLHGEVVQLNVEASELHPNTTVFKISK